MTLQEILLEQQLHKATELERAWLRFQHEAIEQERADRRGLLPSLRSGAASLFVRLGVWIDRSAGERALTPGS